MISIQKIAFAGSGRLATHLGEALTKQGIEITAVWSRNHLSAQKLATKLGSSVIDTFEGLEVDLVIIAVKDDAIASVSSIVPRHLPCAHTSGATAINVLPQAQRGVLWPLQTFSFDEKMDWAAIPIVIEGSDNLMKDALEELGNKLSNSVRCINGDQRRWLHLTAVISCNFSNALYTLSSDLLGEQGLDFDLLHALITKTAQGATMSTPEKNQTGPAARRDMGVINQQLDLLKNHPEWQELYASLTQLIIQQHHE